MIILIYNHGKNTMHTFSWRLYHFIARGNRRQKIFLDDIDYGLYLQFLEEYKERYGFTLYAYSSVPNQLSWGTLENKLFEKEKGTVVSLIENKLWKHQNASSKNRASPPKAVCSRETESVGLYVMRH